MLLMLWGDGPSPDRGRLLLSRAGDPDRSPSVLGPSSGGDAPFHPQLLQVGGGLLPGEKEGVDAQAPGHLQLPAQGVPVVKEDERSEEHTSELQSQR